MSDNPLLSKLKMPGRIFQLPSRGLFYKNGELDATVKEGEIHVHPMSALAEIHMKNPDQLFSGQAVETVFKECVQGVAKPTELLAKDVDAVLMFLRTVTYGPQYEFTATHQCEGAKDHSYVADVDHLIGEIKYIDPTILEKQYTVTLPNGQTVHLQPSRYNKIVEILKFNEGKKEITVDDMKANLMMMLTSVVTQVDDIVDPIHIKDWLSKIQTKWTTLIAERVEAINEWGPSMTWTGKCKDCGEELSVEIPINPITFFIE